MVRSKDSDPLLPEELAVEESPAPPAADEVVTAIGVRPCRNSRFVIANLNGRKITIRVLKGRKNPARQPIKCRHVELDSYEEIR